jgi:integrase
MAYQRGSLKQVPRKEGATWVLRYRVTGADGRRVENSLPVGLVRDFPNEKSAWREVDKLGLCSRVNEAPALLRIRFAQLAEHYLRADFGQDAVRPKSEDTELNMNHIVRDYLIPRFGNEIADQTHAILRALRNPLHRILVLTCAATALRASELVAIRWSDLRWTEERIRVSKRWKRGKDGATKTESSDGYVPLHPRLARHLRAWRMRTPYGSDKDFVFPSLKMSGKVPVSAGVFVADHLRTAAKNSGVRIPEGHRFGLHNLRHSLSNWMVNKAKVEPKTVQGILRHSRIQTTLDLYTQQDSEETRAAQGNYLRTLGTQRKKAS